MILCIFCAGVVIFLFRSRQRLKIQVQTLEREKAQSGKSDLVEPLMEEKQERGQMV